MKDEILADLSLQRVHLLLLHQLFVSLDNAAVLVLHDEQELFVDLLVEV